MKNLIAPELLATLKEEPVSIENIVKFLDNNSSITTSTLCKLIGIPPSSIYNYRCYQKRKANTDSNNDNYLVSCVAPRNSSNSHNRYDAEEKYLLVQGYNKFDDENRSRLLREYGLYTSDISRWDDQIRSAAIEKLSMRKVRSDKKSAEQIKIEELEAELKDQEKATAKLTALIVLQKKTEKIFSQRGKD